MLANPNKIKFHHHLKKFPHHFLIPVLLPLSVSNTEKSLGNFSICIDSSELSRISLTEILQCLVSFGFVCIGQAFLPTLLSSSILGKVAGTALCTVRMFPFCGCSTLCSPLHLLTQIYNVFSLSYHK